MCVRRPCDGWYSAHQALSFDIHVKRVVEKKSAILDRPPYWVQNNVTQLIVFYSLNPFIRDLCEAGCKGKDNPLSQDVRHIRFRITLSTWLIIFYSTNPFILYQCQEICEKNKRPFWNVCHTRFFTLDQVCNTYCHQNYTCV